MSKGVDVLIFGAGPAGLAVALGIARQLHTAIVFGTRQYRNGSAHHMHNVLGWDHEDPTTFRAKARADILRRYDTISFKDAGVASVRKLDSGRFEAVDDAGVRFHCLFCHGYEERGAPSAGVLASGLAGNPMFAPAVSRMASRLAGRINVYTEGNSDFGTEVRKLLKSTKKFHVENRRIKSLAKDPDVEGDAGVLVTLEDGTVNREGFIAHVPDSELNGSFAKDLGLEIAPQGHINAIPPFFSTNVPGIYAAGDCATMLKAVPMATAMGASVAAGLAHFLQAEDDVED